MRGEGERSEVGVGVCAPITQKAVGLMEPNPVGRELGGGAKEGRGWCVCVCVCIFMCLYGFMGLWDINDSLLVMY